MESLLTRRELLYAGGALAAITPRAVQPERCSFEGLLDQRRMIRRFKPEPVGDRLIRRLLRAARRAPSAGHTQPWVFVVVRDRRRRERLARAALGQMFIAQAPVVIVAGADQSRSRARYGSRGDRYALIDASFASMLLLLAATEQGLGACFVGAFDDADVARILRLPDDVLPLAVIPVGYPAENPSPLELRPADDVIRFERWKPQS